jgi:hypothetical protein
MIIETGLSKSIPRRPVWRLARRLTLQRAAHIDKPAAMEHAGWPETKIRKIMGENWLRLLADVWGE